MSQKDMFENEVVEEILRERSNYYLSKNIPSNFWILVSPKFIDSKIKTSFLEQTNFYIQKKSEIEDKMGSKYFSVLISRNEEFIKWVKLRIGFFESIDKDNHFGDKMITSNGLTGKVNVFVDKNVEKGKSKNNVLLSHDPMRLHPDIISKKLKYSMEVYYSKNDVLAS